MLCLISEMSAKVCRFLISRNSRCNKPLNAYAAIILNTHRVVETDLPINAIKVPAPIKICAFRFVQEALNNSFKHAQQSHSVVHCLVDDELGQLSICVEDSDPGFDLATLDSKIEGLGLGGSPSGISRLGGDLTIESPLRSATPLTMRGPLEQEYRL